MPHSHQCRAAGCRTTVANDVDFCRSCADRQVVAGLELGLGLELRCSGPNLWLTFPPIPGRSRLSASTNLVVTARDNPVLRQCLLAFLEEHMPEASAAARRYLAEHEPHG